MGLLFVGCGLGAVLTARGVEPYLLKIFEVGRLGKLKPLSLLLNDDSTLGEPITFSVSPLKSLLNGL